MKVKGIYIIFLALSVIILMPGCINVNQEFSEMTDRIISNIGTDYKKEFQFSVGEVGITVSSWFIDFAAREENVDEMMREISSVQVGIYNRVENSDFKADFSTLESIDEEMDSKGWKYIIRSVENDDLTAIYISADPEEMLNKMYLINLSDEELVIVEVTGDLKKVISYAIEEKNFKIKT